MIIEPSITDLVKKFDSRYTLVIAASKRARELTNGDRKLTKLNSNKTVSIAIQEIHEGKIRYRRNSSLTAPTVAAVPAEPAEPESADGEQA